jgi:hypothetical protein
MMPNIETDAGSLIEADLFVDTIPLVETIPAGETIAVGEVSPRVETIALGETAPPLEPPVKAARPRGKGRAKPVAEVAASKPISRILQLVAALKAEQETPLAERSVAPATVPAAAPGEEPAEPITVLSSLRDILVAREQERGEWEERARSLEGELIEARAAMRTARDAAAQTEAQHRRVIADLKLLHEHQRSIWQLERRRLEITIDGFESERQNKIVKRAARLARPALLAGLLIVLLALAMLSGDTHAGAAGSHQPTAASVH